jgi:hypothetical protein
MRNFFIALATALTLAASATQFYYNSFTTNTDANALAMATNIANAAIQNQLSVSINSQVIEAAGGLDTNNYTLFTDTNGAALWWYQQATNFAGTNLPASLVTVPQLASATNSLWTNSTAYLNGVATTVANTVYSNNPSGYLTPSATNGLTYFGTNVVTSVVSAGGVTITQVNTLAGIAVTLTASGTNNVNVTNLNATSLASYGAFTTLASSWTNYVAPYLDYTNASTYTNPLLSAVSAAATYQTTGAYLTAQSNLDYSNVTNPPAIPSTNGLVTAAITNGLATTNWVQSQGYTNAGILASYATTNYVNNAMLTVVSPSQLNNASNALQTEISANSDSIAAAWPTSQPFIGSILVVSNMTVSLATTNGVITATLGSYGGAVAGFQPSSQNLTNWSSIPTNTILLTTNVITSITAGTTASVALSNSVSGGIIATIGATYTGQSPAAWQSVTFTTPAVSGNSYSGTWSSALLATPTSLKVYYAGASYTVSTLTATTTGFTYADSGNSIGTNKTVTVIGFCY